MILEGVARAVWVCNDGLMKERKQDEATRVQKWFIEHVTYEGEAYTIDYEQALSVVDGSLNAIVVARAGSGKTRTLVAKIVYLVARCGVKPEEIMAFVFNANAAVEINERLSKMCVDGVAVIGDGRYVGDGVALGGVKIASTFHAFSRRVVYMVCGEKEKCGEILAEEKEAFVLKIVKKMMGEARWWRKMMLFLKGEDGAELVDGREKVALNENEIEKLTDMMTQFINRAQQKYLGSKVTVAEVAERYLAENEVSGRERLFIELGVECFRRYHWYLLDAKRGLMGFSQYGTDFNLIVSWASKMIYSGRPEVEKLLSQKKYILIDEYQDFSQLFLAAVEAIRSVAPDAKLFVVGDDWQAINRFAGSEVEYFRNFEGYFGKDLRRYEISTNYRCDKEVVSLARRFVCRSMKEKGNFRAFSREQGKVVVAKPQETEVGYALVPYDLRVSVEDRILREAVIRTGCVVVKKAVVRYLKTVVEIIRENLEGRGRVQAKEIMILHRNNEMNIGGVSLAGFGRGLKWGLDRLGVLSEEEFDDKVRLMTMHKSKGLEADVVVILEADEGVIPKTHPDTILYRMFGETEDIALDDQKRLFYVAMTRAKHRLYILSEGGGFVKYLGRGAEKW